MDVGVKLRQLRPRARSCTEIMMHDCTMHKGTTNGGFPEVGMPLAILAGRIQLLGTFFFSSLHIMRLSLICEGRCGVRLS